MKTNEQNLRYLWDTIKHTKTCIMGVPEGEKRKKEESVLNLIRNIMFFTSKKLKELKEFHTRYIIFQLSRAKDKERILKAAREK